MIEVKYNDKVYKVNCGTTIEQFIKNEKIDETYKYIISLAVVNNNLRELNYKLEENCNIEFLDISTRDGRNAYMRTLKFVFLYALHLARPEAICRIEHSLSNGFYCEINDSITVNRKYAKLLLEKVEEIVNKNYKIERQLFSTEDIIKIYDDRKDYEKSNMIKFKNKKTMHLHKLNDYYDYFYGYMLPSTGLLHYYDVKIYNAGIMILGPDVNDPITVSKFVHQPKLFGIYLREKKWLKTINVPSVSYVNDRVKNHDFADLIRCAEAYHEKNICEIADKITADPQKRIILISGPSSSGKTSFAQRLRIQLMANGKRPISISVDDYFLNREFTPRDEEGNYNFEALDAIDLEKFNEDLDMLISGDEAQIPSFNFKEGKRYYRPDSLIRIEEDQPIIIEGIHGLNPQLTEEIPLGNKFKIYVSALQQINLDAYNRIPTTDLRLIRRIIRDNTHRGHRAADTIAMWDKVIEGERKNIFVYQENADMMFNSTLVYELCILKKYLVPLLEEIDQSSIYYKESKRLLKFMEYFSNVEDESYIPGTSILREFIGGSKLFD